MGINLGPSAPAICVLAACRMLVDPAARWGVPAAALNGPQEVPASSSETGSALAAENVGQPSPIAFGDCCPTRGGVQHGAGIRGSLRAEPGDFHGKPVVERARHWTTDDSDAGKRSGGVVQAMQPEEADWPAMMAVILADIGTSLIACHWPQIEGAHTPAFPVTEGGALRGQSAPRQVFSAPAGQTQP